MTCIFLDFVSYLAGIKSLKIIHFLFCVFVFFESEIFWSKFFDLAKAELTTDFQLLICFFLLMMCLKNQNSQL